MSANIIIGKRKIVNAKAESKENITYYLIFSLDFNAFTAISLTKIAMCWFTGNHFLFVGLFDWGNAET